MPRKVDRAEIISRFKKTHGSKYNYDRVIYTKMKDKVEIFCSIHGSFFRTPDHHIRGTGCPKCQKISSGENQKKASAKVFQSKAEAIHGNYYDYSKVSYSGNKEKIEIICPKHGSFFQTPSNHLSGFGCPSCGRERTEASRKLSKDEFFERCREVHNDYYSYPEQQYRNPESIISVICPSHGKFLIKARNHLWIGQGCAQCFAENRGENKRIDWEVFFNKATELHGDSYKYDQSSYKMLTEPIKIKCEKHGWFEQKGSKHLTGQGCPKCARQLHRGKWNSSKLPKELRCLPSSLYYMKIYNSEEVFYKIGISNDVNRRKNRLIQDSGYEVKILEELNGTLFDCMEMEEQLHKEFEKYSYLPAIQFPGYTECFSLDVLKLES